MKKIKLAQISDIHCGSPYYDGDLMDKTVAQINDMQPDILIVSGDLTCQGFTHEFEMAKDQLSRFKVKRKVIVPGNHDSRNVGYRSYERIIGNPFSVTKIKRDLIVCGADSTEPDLDDGQLGRSHTMELKKVLSGNFAFKVLVLHHHLISVPNSGRERNILRDAGDVLKMAKKSGVNLVLSGHKHIPWQWSFENMKVVTCSTTTSRRVRGLHAPSYNEIDISDRLLKIARVDVETGEATTMYRGGKK
jgi:Icc protein